MDFWSVLVNLRDRLALLPDVKTCKIGLETGLSPDDYPIVRLVPSEMANEGPVSHCNLLVYIGGTIAEADGGLEGVYASLVALEKALRIALCASGGDDAYRYTCRFIKTVFDEDRIDYYKLFAVRFEISFIDPDLGLAEPR